MKTFLAVVAIMLCCAGCGGSDADLVYFNLSTQKILVESISGLPPWASPGVLVPVQGEDRLSAKGMTSSGEVLRIGATLKIAWREGGKLHQAEFKRDELGLPAKLKNGQIRFTYLGNDNWRVRRIE